MSLTCQFTREYKQKNVGKAFLKSNILSWGIKKYKNKNHKLIPVLLDWF